MFNIHCGMPRIAPGLLVSVHDQIATDETDFAYLLPQQQFKTLFRSLINKPVGTMDDLNSRRSADSAIADLTWYASGAISQHALLGTPQELIHASRFQNRAALRIERLGDLFEGYPTTVHLALANQVDYFAKAFEEDAISTVLAEKPFSWFDLVSMLKAAAPRINFVVWDFQTTGTVTSFVQRMLGINETAISAQITKIIQSSMVARDTNLRSREGSRFKAAVDQYDEIYTSDLAQIALIDGVQVKSGGAHRNSL